MVVLAERATLEMEEYIASVSALGRPLDADQEVAVRLPAGEGVFMVAGPGTGKTNALAFRALKLILVDGLAPTAVLATTFTTKAADELRSRILGRGFELVDRALLDPTLPGMARRRLERLDLNQIRTGTLDSIADSVLREYRPGDLASPQLLDEFGARTLMLEAALFDGGRLRDPDLDALLVRLRGSHWNWHAGTKAQLLAAIWDRLLHDRVDLDVYAEATRLPDQAGRKVLRTALNAYRDTLVQRGFMDFPLVEETFLARLQDGSLADFRDGLGAVLVDEYQDTNALQEAIYFELAAASRGALTVVGDDDQSLFRFRGATVELFRAFETRYTEAFGRVAAKTFLTQNYRSTRPIVEFVARFVEIDRDFAPVRVAGKPALDPRRRVEGPMPILGMFRPDVANLAQDLAEFIRAVTRRAGYHLPSGGIVVTAGDGGDVGDAALLCASPREATPNGRIRLPKLLRDELEAPGPESIRVFNPRGTDFAQIPLVQRFGGLVLLCLDPNGLLGALAGVGREVVATADRWRVEAAALCAGDPELRGYVASWAGRGAAQRPAAVSIIELLYHLRHYLLELFEAEGEVYFEVFARQASALAQIGKYKGRVVRSWDQASTNEALRRFVVPIASGLVGVDEDLLESFPRDQLSVLTVHQAKGLEFPLTIVDVGSDFRGNYVTQRPRRFPDGGGDTHRAEDEFAPFAGVPGRERSQRDRAFDDLIRQYFVAFSRAQDVLLLVGTDRAAPTGVLPNVAAGYARDGQAAWASNPPYEAI